MYSSDVVFGRFSHCDAHINYVLRLPDNPMARGESCHCMCMILYGGCIWITHKANDVILKYLSNHVCQVLVDGK